MLTFTILKPLKRLTGLLAGSRIMDRTLIPWTVAVLLEYAQKSLALLAISAFKRLLELLFQFIDSVAGLDHFRTIKLYLLSLLNRLGFRVEQ